MNNALNLHGYALAAALLVGALPITGNAGYFDEGLVYYSQGEYELALQQFTQGVKAGEEGSDYMLMKMYSEGRGASDQNPVVQQQETFRWTLKTAESGIAQAQYQLAGLYSRGQGTVVDPQQAFRWYQAAARQGHPLAMQQLARRYETGSGVAKNADQAQYWYSIAASELDVYAQKGDPGSQNRLAGMYEEGKGVNTNLQTAMNWYRRAALQGLADAQYNLGRVLVYGDVEHNKAQGTYWLQCAANQGHEGARTVLAKLQGTAKSDVALIDQP